MSIYQPSDDSYLLTNVLKQKIPGLVKKNSKLRFLEIGVGSGFQLETLFSLDVKKNNILGSDINSEAVEHCNKLGFRTIRSDLFENINEKFDVIIFNPPYLPNDEKEPVKSKEATTSGKKGNEIIIKFLKQAKKHLSENGKIFLVTSSISANVNFGKLGYGAKVVQSKKIFFEEISVWELLINNNNT